MGINVLTVLCLLGTATSSWSKTLKWKLEPGREYRLSVQREMEQSSDLVAWQQVIRCDYAWVVDAVDDDQSMRVTRTLVSVRHVMQYADEPVVVYDSIQDGEARGESAILARAWRPLLGAKRVLTLLPTGRWAEADDGNRGTRVGGGEGNSAAAGNPPVASDRTPSADPSSTPLAGSQHGEATSLDSRLLRDNLVLPEGEFEIDDRWRFNRSVPWPGADANVLVEAIYTYRGQAAVAEQEMDQFEIEMSWKQDETQTANLVPRIVNQEGAGILWFNSSDGYLDRSELKQRWTIELPRENETPVQAVMSTVMKLKFQPVEIPVEATANAETAPTAKK